MAMKKSSKSKEYIFKTFLYNCASPKDQKIIAQTFSEISAIKNQYIKSYNKCSFSSFEPKFNPTFSMEYISLDTLEKVIKSMDFYTKWSIADIMNCLFAVSEGMLFLHNHLICHGNLCASNVIVDEAKQSYLIDFGLYPIKKLYIPQNEIVKKEYRDSRTNNECPTKSNDVYSYGILVIQIFLCFKGRKQEEEIQKFIHYEETKKFDIFPKIFKEMIPRCIDKQLTFKQIQEMYQDESYIIENIHQHVSGLYQKFIQLNYLENLASMNNRNALNKLGKMYEKGILKDENNQKALFYYKKLADLGNSDGQNKYGMLLLHNSDSEQKKLGLFYLQKSANQGNVRGMCNYGVLLLKGSVIERNIELAEVFLKKSAEFGYSRAIVEYGNSLLQNNPTPQRILKGLECIRSGMDKNNAEAYYLYGILLQNGELIGKNEKLAMEHFKVSADLGYHKAMLQYALGNLKGIGIDINKKVAFRYFKLAAEKGNKKAIKIVNKLESKLPYKVKIGKQESTIEEFESVSDKSEGITENFDDISDESENNKEGLQNHKNQNIIVKKSLSSGVTKEVIQSNIRIHTIKSSSLNISSELKSIESQSSDIFPFSSNSEQKSHNKSIQTESKEGGSLVYHSKPKVESSEPNGPKVIYFSHPSITEEKRTTNSEPSKLQTDDTNLRKNEIPTPQIIYCSPIQNSVIVDSTKEQSGNKSLNNKTQTDNLKSTNSTKKSLPKSDTQSNSALYLSKPIEQTILSKNNNNLPEPILQTKNSDLSSLKLNDKEQISQSLQSQPEKPKLITVQLQNLTMKSDNSKPLVSNQNSQNENINEISTQYSSRLPCIRLPPSQVSTNNEPASSNSKSQKTEEKFVKHKTDATDSYLKLDSPNKQETTTTINAQNPISLQSLINRSDKSSLPIPITITEKETQNTNSLNPQPKVKLITKDDFPATLNTNPKNNRSLINLSKETSNKNTSKTNPPAENPISLQSMINKSSDSTSFTSQSKPQSSKASSSKQNIKTQDTNSLLSQSSSKLGSKSEQSTVPKTEVKDNHSLLNITKKTNENIRENNKITSIINQPVQNLNSLFSLSNEYLHQSKSLSQSQKFEESSELNKKYSNTLELKADLQKKDLSTKSINNNLYKKSSHQNQNSESTVLQSKDHTNISEQLQSNKLDQNSHSLLNPSSKTDNSSSLAQNTNSNSKNTDSKTKTENVKQNKSKLDKNTLNNDSLKSQPSSKLDRKDEKLIKTKNDAKENHSLLNLADKTDNNKLNTSSQDLYSLLSLAMESDKSSSQSQSNSQSHDIGSSLLKSDIKAQNINQLSSQSDTKVQDNDKPSKVNKPDLKDGHSLIDLIKESDNKNSNESAPKANASAQDSYSLLSLAMESDESSLPSQSNSQSREFETSILKSNVKAQNINPLPSQSDTKVQDKDKPSKVNKPDLKGGHSLINLIKESDNKSSNLSAPKTNASAQDSYSLLSLAMESDESSLPSQSNSQSHEFEKSILKPRNEFHNNDSLQSKSNNTTSLLSLAIDSDVPNSTISDSHKQIHEKNSSFTNSNMINQNSHSLLSLDKKQDESNSQKSGSSKQKPETQQENSYPLLNLAIDSDESSSTSYQIDSQPEKTSSLLSSSDIGTQKIRNLNTQNDNSNSLLSLANPSNNSNLNPSHENAQMKEPDLQQAHTEAQEQKSYSLLSLAMDSDDSQPLSQTNDPNSSYNRQKANKYHFNEDTPPDELYSIFKEFKKEFKKEYYNPNLKDKKDKNEFRLFQYENKFIQTNNPQIIYKYAKLYKNDEENKESQEKSMNYFHIAAILGNSKAQAYYGLCLQKGIGVIKDLRLGAKFLKKSAEQGNLNAMNSYGITLFKGIGIDANKEEGLKLLKEAADRGFPESQYQYGLLEEDPFLSHQYIEMAVQNHFTKALFYYAKDFMEGHGVNRDVQKALELFHELYETEKSNKVLTRLIVYLKQIDISLAIPYMKLLADSDDNTKILQKHREQFEYGLELFKGEHVERNIEESIKYLIKSNQIIKIRDEYPEIFAYMPHDFSKVKNEIHRFLKRNGSIDENEQELINNSIKGNIEDTFRAATIIESTGDFDTANFFYEIAADSNHAEASHILGGHYLNGTHGLAKDEEKGNKYINRFLRLTNNGNSLLNENQTSLHAPIMTDKNMLTCEITLSLQPDQTIKGIIEVNENESKINLKESKYLLNTNNSPRLGRSSYESGKPIKSLPHKISFIRSAGTYYLHVLLVDVNGNGKEIMSEGIVTKGFTKTFDYTGQVECVKLSPGTYKLEVWGAEGGKNDKYTKTAGKGGYSTGLLKVTSKTKLFIHVGESPFGTKGGWNGGGSGSKGNTTNGAGGGGATDISLHGEKDSSNWNTSDHLYSRIIVAGGGGGSGNDEFLEYYGGFGGGTTGQCCGYGPPGNEGTQTGAGMPNQFSKGQDFGIGGSHNGYTSSGGGGGWYGGGAPGNSMCFAGGSGGSGYVYNSNTASNYPHGCKLTNAFFLANSRTISGDQEIPNPRSNSNEIGHSGHGYARIIRQ
ncbi:hypothetical protein M9Y10_025120 [Tritrichomonas musculus]|uniref:receptor protein-tyrosine kinase n=1 Tax=Tritrichomonas musculus TaxID=1915356 RepID=A0ABR2HAL0_9EUKA